MSKSDNSPLRPKYNSEVFDEFAKGLPRFGDPMTNQSKEQAKELLSCPFCGSDAVYVTLDKKVVACSSRKCFMVHGYVYVKDWQSRPIKEAGVSVEELELVLRPYFDCLGKLKKAAEAIHAKLNHKEGS